MDIESEFSDITDITDISDNLGNLGKSENSSQAPQINAKKLKNAFSKHFAPILYYEHFKMHQFIKKEEFEKSLKIGKNLLRKFIRATYNSYYSVNYAITKVDIEKFVGSITKVEGFPFSGDELINFLAACENLSFEKEGVEKQSRETFENYSILFDRFKRYVEGNMDTEEI